jgi:hypothetical protein
MDDDRTESSAQATELSREIGAIAAAHAALEPKGRELRSDIVVSSIVQVLKLGPLSEQRIGAEVGRLWVTKSITRPVIRKALEDAQAAGLVNLQKTLVGEEWIATDSALRDVREDGAWAAMAITRFEQQVRERLDDDPDRDRVPEARIPSICTQLQLAIAAGAQGLYALEPAGSNALRPMRFNEVAALAVIKQLEPRSVQQAAQRLFVAAVNPHDVFADEIMHLYVAGNVLHGMVTRRDVGIAPSLEGVRVAVDTSVLVDLAEEDSPAARAVCEAFAMTKALKGEIVVATHTIGEWIRLFDAGDQEIANAGVSDIELGSLAELVPRP